MLSFTLLFAVIYVFVLGLCVYHTVNLGIIRGESITFGHLILILFPVANVLWLYTLLADVKAEHSGYLVGEDPKQSSEYIRRILKEVHDLAHQDDLAPATLSTLIEVATQSQLRQVSRKKSLSHTFMSATTDYIETQLFGRPVAKKTQY